MVSGDQSNKKVLSLFGNPFIGKFHLLPHFEIYISSVAWLLLFFNPQVQFYCLFILEVGLNIDSTFVSVKISIAENASALGGTSGIPVVSLEG